MIIPIIIGATNAVAFRPVSQNHSGILYYWFDTDNGAAGSYIDYNTTAVEEESSGCADTSAFCENGYTGDQLINPSVPNNGVISGATPAVSLYQSK